jgi:hypothetical protein
VEFLTTQQLPANWSRAKRQKVRVNSRHFTIVRHRLFRRETDGILCRCVAVTEVPTIVEACHNSVCSGHFSGQLTGQNILRAWYFWPTLFRDVHAHVRKCDACHHYTRNDLRMEKKLPVSLLLVPFEKWGIDYLERCTQNPLMVWPT